MKKAFTMAEAILVMTILGIIATIMITTLKPAQFKDKGLEIMARKILSEIDTATTQILISETPAGEMDVLIDPTNTSLTFGWWDANSQNKIVKIYKKYLTATRQTVDNEHCNSGTSTAFYLKDGACIGIDIPGCVSIGTIFPGETNVTNVMISAGVRDLPIGVIYVDTNGNEEPNVLSKDRFVFPIGYYGIMYDAE